MSQPPKQSIRRAFERAAPTYDSAAEIQRIICGRLAAALAPESAPETILDAGCGTGYAAELLSRRFPGARLIGLDLSPAMLARVSAPVQRLAADAERLPLAASSLGLYWSSLTLQWCDLGAALAEARRVLAAGGRLAVATLGPDTFAELRTAFAAADAYRHTLAFRAPEEIAALAAAAGFRDIEMGRERLVSHYPELKSLLRAVKAIGANQVGAGRRPGLMSRGAWQRAEAAYEAQRQAAGLPLGYDLVTIHARK